MLPLKTVIFSLSNSQLHLDDRRGAVERDARARRDRGVDVARRRASDVVVDFVEVAEAVAVDTTY